MADVDLKWYHCNPYKLWSDFRLNGLTGLEIGIYKMLLDHMWMHPDILLPDIPKHNCRRCRVTLQEYKAAQEALIDAGLIATGTWKDMRAIYSEELRKLNERSKNSWLHAGKSGS